MRRICSVQLFISCRIMFITFTYSRSSMCLSQGIYAFNIKNNLSFKINWTSHWRLLFISTLIILPLILGFQTMATIGKFQPFNWLIYCTFCNHPYYLSDSFSNLLSEFYCLVIEYHLILWLGFYHVLLK